MNIKHFMASYLALLLAWGAWHFERPDYFWKGILIAALYAVFDLLWTYGRDKTWYFPESSVISGLILALVGATSPSLGLLFLMPLLAVISKQLFWFGKGRHVFNPAAFSLVALSLAGYDAASWWGVSWGAPVLYAVIIAGLFILWRQRRWETALSFLAVYIFLLNFRIFDGTLLFFASVMLIEPMTSSFPGIKNRILYAGLAVFLAFLSGVFIPALDSLLPALLGANLIISLFIG